MELDNPLSRSSQPLFRALFNSKLTNQKPMDNDIQSQVRDVVYITESPTNGGDLANRRLVGIPLQITMKSH